MTKLILVVGMVTGVILPFWNIPLMVRIWRRKSSQDVSLWWAFGVWVCFALMLPSAIISVDLAYQLFSYVNFVLFSTLIVVIIKFR